MRVTVRLTVGAYTALQKQMRKRGVSLDEALNDAVMLGTKPKKSSAFRTKTYDTGVPLVDLDHTNALVAELDNEEFFRKMREGR